MILVINQRKIPIQYKNTIHRKNACVWSSYHKMLQVETSDNIIITPNMFGNQMNLNINKQNQHYEHQHQ